MTWLFKRAGAKTGIILGVSLKVISGRVPGVLYALVTIASMLIPATKN